MNTETITYYEEDGKITGTVTATLNTIDANKVGRWIEGAGDPRSQYIKDGQISERPVQQTVLEGSTLINLPVPCQIRINDEVYNCEDERAELEFNLAGTYQITVVAWPYLDAEFVYENRT